MKCPYCQHAEDRVVDSRETREGTVIRRRRECQECSRRFTSYERIDEINRSRDPVAGAGGARRSVSL